MKQKKYLDKEIDLTATCVRVPVKTSHSESVNIEFEKDYNLKKIKETLSKAPGCKVIDEHKDAGYITPLRLRETILLTFQELERIIQIKKL